MSKLFSNLTIKDITLKNRLAVSPMCQYSSADGFANDYHLVHYGSRAIGGAGLIIQEATAVSPEGRITPGDLGLWKDEHIEKLKNIVKFLEEHGTVPGIQLAHAGRKASCAVPWDGGKQLDHDHGGWTTLAPSAIPYKESDNAPEAIDKEGIGKVVADFKAAAQRAMEAGYKIIEIHAAHGYLVHEFLSPVSNHRTDEYGGSFENRSRLIREIAGAIRSVWPENRPLFTRISVTDYIEGGWDPDQSVQLSARLKDLGVDLIDCSSAGMIPHARIPLGPGYQVAFAERIRKETGILTGAVGLITEVNQAEDILDNDKADLILIARASLRYPYFPLHAARLLGEDIEWPVQYKRAKL